ncbi:MAG: phosphoribosylglycinamide formyltransferase [Bacteroidetes bacterium]|nr:MAG: phosphoribosylglycinamide formyltransferase [Bacteroidota bacterium]RLD73492.1 MAG: phosphoribosylglycinamide formyltransferase [Bacteroidota bacterium]RLD89005.1 MAG: phosphoribosylglycinamide formyltransferase [Bacteroidota bacterium]
MKNIAIFASGNGTNAERIMDYFSANDAVNVQLVLTNNPEAGVIARAQKFDVPCFIFTRDEFYHSDKIDKILEDHHIDFIVLAGFLWLIPTSVVQAFPGRIVNIHPALLPKYGGKGMFGHHVHEAVLANKETQSGITIHYVNEHYDEGNIIFQATCLVKKDDTPESLASRIHELEYAHFPLVIEKLVDEL